METRERGRGPRGPHGQGNRHGDHAGRRADGAIGHRGRGGPRVGPGDVRAALLLLLDDEPGHGYQLIQRIAAQSAGLWQPSPGSVYPALQQLEDEGLIQAEQDEGRRVFHLTEAGRAYVAERRDALAAARDAVTAAVDDGVPALRDLFEQVGAALRQVERAGTTDQIAAARRLLDETRRGVYRILAGDEGVAVGATTSPAAAPPATGA